MKEKVSGDQQLPDKVYFRIGEVSNLVGVDTHVLRYWESEFKQVSPRRASSNQRLYRRKDVEALILIRELLHGRGYTISGARKFLAQSDVDIQTLVREEGEKETSPERLADIKEELQNIQRLLALKSLRY